MHVINGKYEQIKCKIEYTHRNMVF